MIKYVFSDLDNTLLTSDKRITDKNIQTIKDIQKMGTRFLVASGRMPFCFDEFEGDIDISSYCSCNGSIIKLDGELINDKPLKKEDANKLVEFAIEKGVYTRIFTFDWLYCLYPERDSAVSWKYLRQCTVNEKEALKISKNQKVYKVCFHDANKQLLDEIKQEVIDSGMETEAMFSGPNFLEVFYKGQSKGNAILKICEKTNTSIKDTLAMGDAENDLSMLKVAGVAACPINSIQEIKEICDYVSDLTCDEDAVSQILEKYVKNA